MPKKSKKGKASSTTVANVATETEAPSASTSSPEKKPKKLRELKRKVFDDKKVAIREAILKHVIFNNDSIKSTDDTIRACRLVRKSWYQTISKLVAQSREPFYKLRLDRENSCQESAKVKQEGKLLDQFISTVTSTSGLDNPVPPFKIIATPSFFLKENHDSLSKCLSLVGDRLVELDMEFAADGGSMPFLFPNFTLPKLTKLSVFFRAQYTVTATTPGQQLANIMMMIGDNFHAIYFVQSILTASSNLEIFEVFDAPSKEKLLVSCAFGYLTLPKSLTNIKLWCTMTSEHLQVLIKNELPNLIDLDFIIPFIRFEDGTIFRVLKNVQNSLEKLCIRGTCHDGHPKIHTLFTFPRMFKLQRLEVSSIHCGLEPGFFELGRNVPVLHEIILYSQTIYMFKRWTMDSKMESVRKVAIRLDDEHFDYYDLHRVVNIDLECMQLVQSAFPNVYDLEITLSGVELKGLEHVFKEMNQLIRLKITFVRCDDVKNSDLWDALLIGIPVNWASVLKTTPEFWEALEIKNQVLPSIKQLTELKILELSSADCCSIDLKNVPLISDSVFQFAFLKMSKLQHLVFDGRFMVSSEMTQKWEALNRQLTVYNDCENWYFDERADDDGEVSDDKVTTDGESDDGGNNNVKVQITK